MEDATHGKEVKTLRKEARKVGFFELYSYASLRDCVLLILAILAALLRSLVFPIVILVYGELIAMFIDRSLGTSSVTHFLPIFDGGKIL